MLKVVFLVIIVQITTSWAASSEYFLDIDDILNESLMPATFLMLEGQPGEELLEPLSGRGDDIELPDDGNGTLVDASMEKAYSTMGFHRKKIGEYLCSTFVAAKIIADVMPAAMGRRGGVKKISRRVGTVDEMSQNDMVMNTKELMLYDQGSANYQNWLTKTTTLEDIYKNYASKNMANSSVTNHSFEPRYSRKDTQSHKQQMDYEDDAWEVGAVTGYAVHEPANNNEHAPKIMNESPAMNHQHFTDMEYSGPVAGSKTAVPTMNVIYDNSYMIDYLLKNGYKPNPSGNMSVDSSQDSKDLRLLAGEGYGEYDVPHSAYGPHSTGLLESMSKSLGLKDLFDIALTTLAFLSFGMFILQVIMCITMTKNDSNMLMMPMEIDDGDETVMVDGGGGDAGGGGEMEVRQKREIHPNQNVATINELAKRVLKSIDAVLEANDDQATCFQRIVCDNNGFSRGQTDGQKYWIPVWGLGLSWLSSRIIRFQPPSNSILDGLKASVIGLGGGNCAKFYSSCDRKRKRSKKL